MLLASFLFTLAHTFWCYLLSCESNETEFGLVNVNHSLVVFILFHVVGRSVKGYYQNKTVCEVWSLCKRMSLTASQKTLCYLSHIKRSSFWKTTCQSLNSNVYLLQSAPCFNLLTNWRHLIITSKMNHKILFFWNNLRNMFQKKIKKIYWEVVV